MKTLILNGSPRTNGAEMVMEANESVLSRKDDRKGPLSGGSSEEGQDLEEESENKEP